MFSFLNYKVIEDNKKKCKSKRSEFLKIDSWLPKQYSISCKKKKGKIQTKYSFWKLTVSYQTKKNFFELMRSHLNTQTIIRLPFFQLTHLYLLCVNCLLCQVLAKHWNLATITIQAKDAARHSFMEDAVEMPITLKLWLRVLTPVPWLYRNTPFNLKELRCITKK